MPGSLPQIEDGLSAPASYLDGLGIPAIAIPVALVATFFVLKLIGFSVNLLTLSAMVLAIAIVVDDAIVVVEGVHAKLDQGYKSSREASIDAMSELGGAIVSITLVMMSVFIPA